MVERQARDLEVRVRVPVPGQIFLLKFDDGLRSYNDGFLYFNFSILTVSEVKRPA